MHSLQGFILRELRNKPKRYRLYSVSAVASDGRNAAHCRGRNIGVHVHIRHRFNGINGRNPIGAAADCRLCGRTHTIHIRRQLCQNRNMTSLPGSRSETLHQLRDLSDIRAQPALCHIRAGKIQLHGIRAVLFAEPCQFSPFLFILAHNGSENEFGRIICLQASENLHVLLHAVVGKLFDILKSDQAPAFSRDSGKARGSFVDIHGTDGFVADTRPSRFKRPCTHIIIARHNR